MKVLVVLGHPREPSLCAALADAYANGAIGAGMDVEQLYLGSMDFDLDVHSVSPRDQPLEPDLSGRVGSSNGLIIWSSSTPGGGEWGRPA